MKPETVELIEAARMMERYLIFGRYTTKDGHYDVELGMEKKMADMLEQAVNAVERKMR